MVAHSSWMLALSGWCSLTSAFPSNRFRIPNGHKVPCPENGVGCKAGMCLGIGHDYCGGGGSFNDFGKAFLAANQKWTKTLCEADSDGDGLTNGEELGDPCCLWGMWDVSSAYMEGHTPSHPGVKTSKVANYQRPACGTTAPKAKAPQLGLFNPGEVEKHVDLLIDNYTIPMPGTMSDTTSYVDIAFNFPDESMDMFHVVMADAVVKSGKILHHYVVEGCEGKWPAELHGKQVTSAQRRGKKCVDMNGWVPGRKILEMPRWAGFPVGKTAGIQSFKVNVHYDNQEKKKGFVSRDGLRIYYTPTLRNESLVQFSTMQVSSNPTMMIPARKERYFMTRQCKLSLTGTDGTTPMQGQLLSIGFHAHLLGTEMYAERIRDGVRLPIAEELRWHFDDQYRRILYLRNITVKSGDILQTSCIFNSNGRSKVTLVGLETADEMCWASFTLTAGGMKAKCTGQIWTGELDSLEDGFNLDSRHPVSSADGVWDGSVLRTGGDLVSSKLEAIKCMDHPLVKNYCPMIAPNLPKATETCNKTMGELGYAMKQIENFKPQQMCCSVVCDQICPQHEVCTQSASKPTEKVTNAPTSQSGVTQSPQGAATSTALSSAPANCMKVLLTLVIAYVAA